MKEKLRVSATVWDNLPESNRQQLMVVLGEMAYNAVKSAHTGKRKIDGYNTVNNFPHVQFPSWKNTAASP
jgi:hypothetical protein